MQLRRIGFGIVNDRANTYCSAREIRSVRLRILNQFHWPVR